MGLFQFLKQTKQVSGNHIAEALDMFGRTLESEKWTKDNIQIRRYIVRNNVNYFGPSLVVEVYVYDDARYSTLADRWFMVFSARKYEGKWYVNLFDKGDWCNIVLALTPPSS